MLPIGVLVPVEQERPIVLLELARNHVEQLLPRDDLDGLIGGPDVRVEHYGPLQSDEAIRHAGEILAFVRAQMA